MSRKKTKTKNITEKINDFDGWFEELKSESDRATAVLGGAYLDACFEGLLRSFMIDKEDIQDRLLETSCPLASFGARIDLAYSIGLLTQMEYDDSKKINEIRNIFAHHLHGRKFQDSDIADKCDSLRLPHRLGRLPGKPRKLFIVSLCSIIVIVQDRQRNIQHQRILLEPEIELLSDHELKSRLQPKRTT